LTELNTASAWQHPVEDQEWKILRRGRFFCLFRTADGNDIMAATLQQAFEAIATFQMILNE
jgi:hypothetical protein